ncbi:MAG: NAD(P)/FAD-dependent oxidoreductase [candidate division Zixibacteria bacterium]|nr:NAD(P)/FAD-dependent oxidoreductase [candidate division Zixibacteria bacterium]
MAKLEEVIIIGAGPSGISAAIQLKRYGLEPVLFERQTLIIASGTEPRKFPDIDYSLSDKSRLYYEVEPLADISNEKIAIVGSGDIAFDYALSLSRKNEVIILNRSDKFKCLPLLWERALKSRNIVYHENTPIKAIRSNPDGLHITCRNRHNIFEVDARYLLIAIGRKPCLGFVSENLKPRINSLRKSKTLYIIGDAGREIFRQVAISVGDGVKAAMEINRQINKRNS